MNFSDLNAQNSWLLNQVLRTQFSGSRAPKTHTRGNIGTGTQILIGMALLVTSCSGRMNTSVDGSVLGPGGSSSSGGATPGGSASNLGGSSFASGGTNSTNALDICSSDADCLICAWSTAPANSTQCDSGWYCCYGVPLTQARCNSNQAAWTSNCPNTNTHVACPCAYEVCSVACANGLCTGSCGVPTN